MEMHDLLVGIMVAPLRSVMAVLAGFALGLVFYVGLWWTVGRVATFRRPMQSILTSILLRMSVALGGFYAVADGDWTRLLFCLMGFLLARAAVTWHTRLPSLENGRVHASIGIGHAP